MLTAHDFLANNASCFDVRSRDSTRGSRQMRWNQHCARHKNWSLRLPDRLSWHGTHTQFSWRVLPLAACGSPLVLLPRPLSRAACGRASCRHLLSARENVKKDSFTPSGLSVMVPLTPPPSGSRGCAVCVRTSPCKMQVRLHRKSVKPVTCLWFLHLGGSFHLHQTQKKCDGEGELLPHQNSTVLPKPALATASTGRC